MPADNNGRGFTLIELAIVIAIISLIVAGALGSYKVQVAQAYHETTQDRITLIRTALTKYRAEQGRLPCPARLDAPPNTPLFGIEDVTAEETCSTSVPSTGTFRASSTRNLPADPLNTVRTGAVPVTELGLPQETAFDSWGRRFVYAVSERLADQGTPYAAAHGTITVLNADGVAVTPQHQVPFAVISHGKNGRGGITYEGKAFAIACPTLTNSPERENCDLDEESNTTFRDTPFSETGNDATHFDDYIGYTFVNLGHASAQRLDSAKNTTNENLLVIISRQQARIDMLEKKLNDMQTEIQTIKSTR